MYNNNFKTQYTDIFIQQTSNFYSYSQQILKPLFRIQSNLNQIF